MQNAVAAEEQKLRAELAKEEAILSADERDRIATLESDLATRLSNARDRIAASLESDLAARLDDDLAKRLKRDRLTRSRGGQELLGQGELLRVTKGVRSEYRSFLNAVLDARLAQDEARLSAARARADARIAEDEARFDAAKARAKSRADARVTAAERKLTKAIAKELENALPTSKSGSEWWIDPIIGLRGQINITRWLFLALQGDVGGFGAGSQIAWQASGSVGFNLTRNIFLETG